jgi:response regulator of citrate/malate metabolism
MIITGDTAPKSLRVIQASGYCYLPKPVTAERLRTQLSKLLETARELPQPASIAN